MKIVIVGASGEIGRAVAAELSPRHEIVAVSRNGPARADVTNPASMRKLFETLGKMDAIVCTAGKVHFAPLSRMTAEHLRIGLNDKLMGQVELAMIGEPPFRSRLDHADRRRAFGAADYRWSGRVHRQCSARRPCACGGDRMAAHPHQRDQPDRARGIAFQHMARPSAVSNRRRPAASPSPTAAAPRAPKPVRSIASIEEVRMPVVRITMLKGKPPEYIEAISNGVARALVEAYEVREGDRYHIIDEYEPGRLIFDRTFAGGPRSDDFLIVSITAGSRPREVKEAFLPPPCGHARSRSRLAARRSHDPRERDDGAGRFALRQRRVRRSPARAHHAGTRKRPRE
jgi:hypothetical protein